MEASVAMKWVIDETGTPETLLLRGSPDPGASTGAARCKVQPLTKAVSGESASPEAAGAA
jgi:hypothetical protein